MKLLQFLAALLFPLEAAATPDADAIALSEKKAWLPPASEAFSRDADENMTGDSQFIYRWDAENRLRQIERKAAAVAAGAPELRVTFTHDGAGRRVRIERETRANPAAAWTATDERRLVWDGWTLAGELDAAGNVLATYAWGLDMSGSEQGLGGIGGLLWQSRDGSELATLYDGHGNVCGLLDASGGEVTARYAYGPFGEPLRTSGPDANPFRFSTHYADAELGLVNYGLRDYRPDLGRWLTRDPLGEAGGVNLFGFVGNDPVSGLDYLGMFDPAAFLDGAKNLIKEPMKMAADLGTLGLIGINNAVSDTQIFAEDASLASSLAERQRQRVLNGGSAGEVAAMGAAEVGLDLVTVGGYSVGKAHTELWKAYNAGRININQLDSALSEIAGGASAAAILAKVLPRQRGVPEESGSQPAGAAAAVESINQGRPTSAANAAMEANIAAARQALIKILSERCRQGGGEPTIREIIGDAHPDSMIHITTASEARLAGAGGVHEGSHFVRLGDVSHMTVPEYQSSVVGINAAGSTSGVTGFVVKNPGAGRFIRAFEKGSAGVDEHHNVGPLIPDRYVPLQ